VPVRILSITPECPFFLVVTWEEPDPSGVHAPPEDIRYIVMFRESGEPSIAMIKPVGTETVRGHWTKKSLQWNHSE